METVFKHVCNIDQLKLKLAQPRMNIPGLLSRFYKHSGKNFIQHCPLTQGRKSRIVLRS